MKVNKILSLLLTAVLMSGVLMLHAFAQNGNFTVQFDVTYGQTEARSMLPLINELRKPANAWYWNQNDTSKLTATGLKALVYDYELEKIAMQRAAELAVYYSPDHARPTGESCFKAYTYSTRSSGENIAWGYYAELTAEEMFTDWAEENESYSGQGHRRNMLDSSYVGVGIGHVIVGNYHFWVQEFGSPLSNTAKTAPLDETVRMTVTCSPSIISPEWTIDAESPITLSVGGTASLPAVTGLVTMRKGYGQLPVQLVSPDLTVSPSSVAVIGNGKLKGVNPGTATLKLSGSNSGSVTVTVTAASAANKPGDVDGDGKITAADARLALRASVGMQDKEDVLEGSAGYLAADVNSDGKVGSDDARLILRASVGLEDSSQWGK
jgi:uncharacterized protein YkwD